MALQLAYQCVLKSMAGIVANTPLLPSDCWA